MMHERLQRDTRTPAFLLKLRLWEKLTHIAQAQIRHGMHVRRQAKDLRQLHRVKNTHPPYPKVFSPCGQPEILHSQTDAEQIGLDNSVAAQDVRATARAVARDAQV